MKRTLHRIISKFKNPIIRLFCILITASIYSQSISYSGGFTESASNLGSVDGSMVASLSGDFFAQNELSSHVTLGNIPTGLTATLTRNTPTNSTWQLQTPAETNLWEAVAYGNGLFVAVASSGTNRVMTSPDGITWTARTGHPSSWKTITYGNGRFVALADEDTNNIMTSTDGINWTLQSTPTPKGLWKDITYGNGQFLGVSVIPGNNILSSTDGIVWTNSTGTTPGATSVAYGNGLFVIGISNLIRTSPDGVTWTTRTAPGGIWLDITYGNGLFVAVSPVGPPAQITDNSMITSPDGINWTARTLPTTNLQRITYGGGLFVAMSGSGTTASISSDGINWQSQAIQEGTWRPTAGKGKFVAVANTGTNRVMTSIIEQKATLSLSGSTEDHQATDNVTNITFDFANAAFADNNAATIINATGPANSNLGIAFTNNSTIISYAGGFTESVDNIGSVDGSIVASLSGDFFAQNELSSHVTLGNIPTGLTATLTRNTPTNNAWQLQTPAETNPWEAIAYGNGLFVAVASSGTNRVMTSPDGISWTARAGHPSSWKTITYGNGRFVALASEDTDNIMTSTDGISWTLQSTPTSKGSWQDITYGNGQFLGVSVIPGNNLLSSTDGIVWTNSTGTTPGATSVAYGNGLFVIGISYLIRTSPDGVTWTTRTAPGGIWFDITYGNGLFVAVSPVGPPAQNTDNSMITSPDGINWTARTLPTTNLQRITYGGGLFVAMSGSGTTASISSDGINWQSQTIQEGAWRPTAGKGKFVAMANTGTNRVMTSVIEQKATLSLSGSTEDHQATDNVTNITFNFANAAFVNNNAAAIVKATGPSSSNLGIAFTNNPLTNWGTNVTGDWHTVNNWDTGVPTAVSIANISADRNVSASAVIDVNTLTIENGASLTTTANVNNTGTIVIDSNTSKSGTLITPSTTNMVSYVRGGFQERDPGNANQNTNLRWSIVSPPVVGQKIKDFVENATNDIAKNVAGTLWAVGYYDGNLGTGGEWVYYTVAELMAGGAHENTTFQIGTSYAIARNTAGSVTFTGTLEVNTVNKTVTNSQWNAIGNPYTAFIPATTTGGDVNNFLSDNAGKFADFREGVYVWDNQQSRYVGYNLSSVTSLTPGQGFLVKTSASGTSMTFNGTRRSIQPSSGNTGFNRSAEAPSIQLKAQRNDLTIDTFIKYFDNATKALDAGYDLADYKDDEFDLYTKLLEDHQDVNFSIQSLPNSDHEQMEITVGLSAKAGDIVTFSAEVLNMPNGMEVILEDRTLGTFTNLSDLDAKYTITLEQDIEGTGRFYLQTQSSTLSSDDNPELSSVKIFTLDNTSLRIEGLASKKGTLALYTINGKKVFNTTFVGNNSNDIVLPTLSAGVYIVNLSNSELTLNKKIIIKY